MGGVTSGCPQRRVCGMCTGLQDRTELSTQPAGYVKPTCPGHRLLLSECHARIGSGGGRLFGPLDGQEGGRAVQAGAAVPVEDTPKKSHTTPPSVGITVFSYLAVCIYVLRWCSDPPRKAARLERGLA